HDQAFVEVETPFLGKPTPEGARDYLVPSRVNPGYFYALPQSPQLMKQLLMIAGTDRYYQVARCFRDEDLRANRQPEFTQVDIEMSFVDMDDVMAMNEELLVYLFKEFKGIELKRPFPKMSYDEAMAKYGSDKPDLRYGFEIHDLSGIGETADFDLLKVSSEDGDAVLGINFNGLAENYTRKKLDKLASYAKGIGASGLLWLKKENGEVASSFNKFLTDDLVAYLDRELGLQEGDLAVMMVGNRAKTQDYMGMVRIHMAGENLTFDPEDFAMTWIVDFPMFEYSEEEGRYVAMHHPFTHPVEEDIPLLDKEPEKVRAKAYDIVINGDECGGGSIRINNAELQNKIFQLLKLTQEDIDNRFGFFTEALQYGTPPHGGIAYGLDRLVMTLIGRDSIKDVIAFPKTQTASDLMTQAPTSVTRDQLDELHLKVETDQ
ncbi:MAG: aspartate--tRNA ligase, partial [Firmicutes bacterium]|nr:aspartate--tRNA ligase [Bacillota bacterium]